MHLGRAGLCRAVRSTVCVSAGSTSEPSQFPQNIPTESEVADLERTHTFALAVLPRDARCESEHRDLYNEVLSPDQACVIPVWVPKSNMNAPASSEFCTKGEYRCDDHKNIRSLFVRSLFLYITHTNRYFPKHVQHIELLTI